LQGLRHAFIYKILEKLFYALETDDRKDEIKKFIRENPRRREIGTLSLGPYPPLGRREPRLLNKMKTRRYSNDNLGNISLEYKSLELAHESLKFYLIGVAGVYKLINSNDPSRFYIGSSVNLSRRIQEYIYLTNGIRRPHSSSEVEISNTPASNWIFVILEFTIPQLALVNEQYALIKFKPTINKYLTVVPRINPQWDDLNLSIRKIEDGVARVSLFDEDSFGYVRFNTFLKAYTIAKILNNKFEITQATCGEVDNYYNHLVFVYDNNDHNKTPIVYSSINKALKSLSISYSTLIDCVTNKYFFKKNLILSFEPLVKFYDYDIKPEGDNQLRKTLLLFKDTELVFEFKSEREMARHFKIDAKLARSAISKGAFEEFTLICKLISYRKKVFVFESKTLNFITEIKSINLAMTYAKVNFYTMKSLLETNKEHNGKIYSYSKTFN
jgi:hypothetical protein